MGDDPKRFRQRLLIIVLVAAGIAIGLIFPFAVDNTARQKALEEQGKVSGHQVG
ncbi:MAG: hypothetical protein ACFB6S_03740 [Geminicoccaceae bacterium]